MTCITRIYPTASSAMNRTVVPSPALYPMKSKRPCKNFQPPSSVRQ
nr:MAG TPA: hypothetical protein [Caudoviricetes sp.]